MAISEDCESLTRIINKRWDKQSLTSSGCGALVCHEKNLIHWGGGSLLGVILSLPLGRVDFLDEVS